MSGEREAGAGGQERQSRGGRRARWLKGRGRGGGHDKNTAPAGEARQNTAPAGAGGASSKVAPGAGGEERQSRGEEGAMAQRAGFRGVLVLKGTEGQWPPAIF